MNLTDYDKSLLNGDHGEAARIGMNILTGLGDSMGAEKIPWMEEPETTP
ncbi:MAG: DUF521 domain-containing protein [Pseudodesulfovibrio sp.]|nr:DUF521 domain-containing protein [Pseudodesulfovibrio sp.]